MQLLHCDNIHFVFRLIVSINALASLRSLTPTRSDVSQPYLWYGMYTRSAECGVSELRLVSRWFAVNRRLLFLSRVAYTMFSELMRSYLGCRSSLTMVGIQFVLPLICGRWGYTLRIYALYIRLKTQEPPASGKLLKALAKLYYIKCAIIKHTKGTIALSQSDGFASS